ncbi:MAG: OsmC family protein [Candidatus Hodarchaeales archaeon]
MKQLYPDKHDINIKIDWNNSIRGQVTGHDDLKIGFDSPEVFGGKGASFYPDELFLGAITSCFVTTFISIIRRFDEEEMKLDEISLATKSTLFRDKNYITDEIIITGRIVFQFVEDPALIKRCIVLSKKNCHILASINPEIAIKIDIELIITKDEDNNHIKENVSITD